MEQYIPISKINDFLYCPLSLYLHTAFEDLDRREYQDETQIIGKLVHRNIDKGEYSTARRYFQGMSIYSERYNLGGKIDIYDQKERALIERKNKVKNIYLGYRYQLYAEFFCMLEMGYKVEKLFLHSLSDNKRYQVPLPDEEEKLNFEKILEKIKNFTLEELKSHSCLRCFNHIYNALAW